ncbi:hypothetical protein [Kitasatospora nipponensis]|uniref:hypothetical protein n=1 Tax=Kitasatospora nipponensis TaxID=258049 RepID=UPI0031DD075F
MTTNQTASATPEDETAAAEHPLPRRQAGTHWKTPPAQPSGGYLPTGPTRARLDPRAAARRTADFLQHEPTERWLSVAEAFDTPSAVRPTSNGR